MSNFVVKEQHQYLGEEMANEEVEGFDESEEIEDIVMITDEDGNQIECILIAIMELDGVDYAILAPVESAGDDGDDVELFLFTYSEDEEKEEEYFGPIEDDATYEKLREAFAQLMEYAEDT